MKRLVPWHSFDYVTAAWHPHLVHRNHISICSHNPLSLFLDFFLSAFHVLDGKALIFKNYFHMTLEAPIVLGQWGGGLHCLFREYIVLSSV